MDILVSKLDTGYLLTYYYPEDMKSYREAFMDEKDILARVQDLWAEEDDEEE